MSFQMLAARALRRSDLHTARLSLRLERSGCRQQLQRRRMLQTVVCEETRSRSAWNGFVAAKYQEFKKEDPSATFKEALQACSPLWREMTDGEKQKFRGVHAPTVRTSCGANSSGSRSGSKSAGSSSSSSSSSSSFSSSSFSTSSFSTSSFSTSSSSRSGRSEGRKELMAADHWRQCYGKTWYYSKLDMLMHPTGPVWVSTPIKSLKNTRGQAKRFSTFESHRELLDFLDGCEARGVLHGINEVVGERMPRCLYFDLDGDPGLRDWHDSSVELLCLYVHWFFGGDAAGWTAEQLEPTILVSEDPDKYSCHIIFPQIQFKDYDMQNQYMVHLLPALRAVEVSAQSEESSTSSRLPLLETVVDKVPYTRFQNFRSLQACKLKDDSLQRHTQFKVQRLFRGDRLTSFIGYVNPEYALPIGTPQQLLEQNEPLRQFLQQQRAARRASGLGGTSPNDMFNLYCTTFQQPEEATLDLSKCDDVEIFEKLLKLLHPSRASQYWSWFRLSGVTFTLLERHQDDPEARARIWAAHHSWSSAFDAYDAEENKRKVEEARGRRVSGLGLLQRLAKFDNPGMEIILPQRGYESLPVGPLVVFVTMLPRHCREDHLAAAFSRFGCVAQTELICDAETEQPMGYARVTFKDEAAVKNALASSEMIFVAGCPVDVQQGRILPQDPEEPQDPVDVKKSS
eukprot:TRINITY_DN9411_c0_g1_i1.p1 TRINITY_DN9411_c0_g1~~TRINITY_DN9411_c0_g1_i1.p1  ORF type:complete len:683 (+),score=157.39 TRINITY_DN9411_c0_g1_i1:65-2113(+)